MSEIHMKVFHGILHLFIAARFLLARVFGEQASYSSGLDICLSSGRGSPPPPPPDPTLINAPPPPPPLPG